MFGLFLAPPVDKSIFLDYADFAYLKKRSSSLIRNATQKVFQQFEVNYLNIFDYHPPQRIFYTLKITTEHPLVDKVRHLRSVLILGLSK